VTREATARWLFRTKGRPNGCGLRILFYHRVSGDRDELAVTPDRFREQMDFLACEGYRVVDVAEAADLLDDRGPDDKLVALSFDDGYRDVVDNGLPILAAHGFRATVFVATGVLDGDTSFAWYRRQPPVLTWEDIIRLDGDGILRFEPHTISHPNLLALDDPSARHEILGSKRAVERRLGREAFAFCYPGGLFGTRERSMVAEAGFRVAVSCEPGANTPDTDRLALRRIPVNAHDRLLDFRAKVGGGHDSSSHARGVYRRLRYGAPSPGSLASRPRRLRER
jgi:peptidoglycan/xylan/chitin deacetylase (PgdA/CDA1 family)